MKVSLMAAVSAVLALDACGAAQPPRVSQAIVAPAHAGGESSAFTVIHAFAGGTDDGAEPYAGLVEHNGTLYGTTASGGAKEAGTVFTVTPSGGVTLLHSFNVEDGAQPWATPTFFHATMFGTTASGGDSGYGNVYALQKSGKYRVVITFTLDNKGGQAYGGAHFRPQSE
ncbi:MAG TPA: choice-of-anchor tandem repeat GloVer-containing protein [Candidatus Acidoferrum sp.]|nr:choice-of-anchor tandem repeat GloVer-containing protein [Candidatus Acidoferrum sp.]